MRRTIKWPSVNIYGRLVLALLVVMAPMYALSLSINEQGNGEVRNEIVKSMQANTHFYTNLLEVEFAQTILLLQEYAKDEDLYMISDAAAIMSNVEITEAYNRIQNRLILLKNTSPYIARASVYLPSVDRQIASDNFRALPEDEYRALQSVRNIYEEPFLLWNGRLFVSIVMTNFVLAVEISQGSLAGMLEQFNAGKSGKAVIMSDDGGWTIGAGAGDGLPGLIRAAVGGPAGDTPSAGTAAIETAAGRYFVAYEQSPTLGLTLFVYLPEREVLGPLQRYRQWVWILSAASLLLIVLFSYSIFRIIHHPLRTLVAAFRKVERGDLAITVTSRGRTEFSYLYDQFNKMVRRLGELINEVYEQQYRARLSELRQLQSQINPHFLYNCFYNLHRMARMEEVDKVASFSRHIGNYFRFVSQSKDRTTLGQELEFARTYVEIQRIRFEDHIAVAFDPLPERYAGITVPKLILQPIIENCYVHGLEDQERSGEIRVSFAEKEDGLTIGVEDNGDRLSDEALQRLRQHLTAPAQVLEGTGILNVHRRLQLEYGPGAGLAVGRGALGGLRVELHIRTEPHNGEERGEHHVPAADCR